MKPQKKQTSKPDFLKAFDPGDPRTRTGHLTNQPEETAADLAEQQIAATFAQIETLNLPELKTLIGAARENSQDFALPASTRILWIQIELALKVYKGAN